MLLNDQQVGGDYYKVCFNNYSNFRHKKSNPRRLLFTQY
jgi:hypothetical protein